MTPFEKHLAAIKAGTVTKANVRGLRQAFNTFERVSRGYSIGSKNARFTAVEIERIETALAHYRPLVIGELHASGVKLLQSPRYRKQLVTVRGIVDDLHCFHLVGFDFYGRDSYTPVYRAYASNGKSFPFRNIPWQSGGKGPELVSPNYF